MKIPFPNSFIEPQDEKPMSNYFVRDPTLYKKLGVSPTAKQEEIVKKFHEKIRIYHPDQQLNKTPQTREYAELKTQELNAIYEILKDPKSRILYDIAGLNDMKKITLDPNAEYASLDELREKVRIEQRRLQKIERENIIQFTSSTKVGFNLEGNNKMSASPLEGSVHWQQPLSDTDILIFHSRSSFGDDSHSWKSNLMNGMTYHRLWNQKEFASIEMLFGHHLSSSGRTRTNQARVQTYGSIMLGGNYELDVGNDFSLGGQVMTFVYPVIQPTYYIPYVKKDLGDGYKGKILLNVDQFSPTFVVSGKQDGYTTETEIKTGKDNSIAHEIVSEIGDFDITLRGEAGYSLDTGKNFAAEFGFSTAIENDYEIGTSYRFSSMEGFDFSLKFKKNRNEFSLPIHISDELSWKSISFTVLVPTFITWLFSRYVIKPMAKRKKAEQIRAKREMNFQQNQENQERAVDWQKSVKDELQRIMNNEISSRGLVIQSARYGVFDEEYDGEHPGYIDVTQALQHHVQDHKIHLGGTIKSILPGFYDPCPGELKQLEVIYLFQDKLHKVEIDDEDELNLPLIEHLL